MPRLSDLPAPPTGKTGWPWTSVPEEMSGEAAVSEPPCGWPSLSIVTPSYNQAEFVEAAIRSVLLQDYPNLQYIVRDGGSTDGSIEVIEKYEPWIEIFVSEPDEGQSDAINKGLRDVDGEIWAYFNSDDLYMPNTFHRVANVFARHEDLRWVTGTGEYFRGTPDNVVHRMKPVPDMSMVRAMTPWRDADGVVASQVANFMRRDVLDEYGFFDTSLHYAMDFDFGLRLLVDDVRPYVIEDVLAKARLHDQSKTVSLSGTGAFRREQYDIIERFIDRVSPADREAVKHHVRQARLHAACAQAINAPSAWKGLTHLARATFRHPSYVGERAFLGAIRRLLFAGGSNG